MDDEDFFPPVPEPDPEDGVEPSMPPWVQPPDDRVSGLVADRRVLARQGGVVVLLSHLDAYPEGVDLVLRVVARRPEGTASGEWMTTYDQLMGYGGRGRVNAEERLRFGVQFPDGTKATTLDHDASLHDHEVPPRGPVLNHNERGGGGGPDLIALDHGLWLWPLPPAETFDLVVEWRAMGIGLQRVPLDGAAIAAAGERAGPLFT